MNQFPLASHHFIIFFDFACPEIAEFTLWKATRMREVVSQMTIYLALKNWCNNLQNAFPSTLRSAGGGWWTKMHESTAFDCNHTLVQTSHHNASIRNCPLSMHQRN
jgi:hypothetical protein